MYKGWIIADPEDWQILANMGITLGKWNEVDITFEDCMVSDKAMEELDKLWGQFYWGLEQVEED